MDRVNALSRVRQNLWTFLAADQLLTEAAFYFGDLNGLNEAAGWRCFKECLTDQNTQFWNKSC